MLEKRLEELRREFQSGRELLERLDRERSQTHETLLRISGAIQVLEELAQKSAESTAA
jgi:predicted nuclease with TOPRIM domain